ncbi:MAG: hypothetical protein ACFFD6_02860 [Candidatus Thorarchaeota archaeon]
MPDRKEQEDPWGLLIPIVVLGIVWLATGVGWLFIPILILACVLFHNIGEEMRIQAKRREMDYWRAPEAGTYTSGHMPEYSFTDRKPIYDRKKQKQEGADCGVLVPIAFLIVFWMFTGVFWVAIPIAVLVIVFLSSITGRSRGRAQIRDYLEQDDVESVQDIADRTGMPEERVRRHIVHEKRSGATDIWFDSSTGTRSSRPLEVVSPDDSKSGCPYCGFALKPADRFCPFCGAPIRA